MVQGGVINYSLCFSSASLRTGPLILSLAGLVYGANKNHLQTYNLFLFYSLALE